VDYVVGIASWVLIGAGVLIAAVGFLGLAGALPRNRFAGIRTPATLRDEETFALANRVGGLPVGIGGCVSVLGGAVALLVVTPAVQWLGLALGFVGMVALVLIGGLGANKAAEAMPAQSGSGCAGCACGGCGG